MQSAKETAANMAASAKAGMEKTKATVQEKGEKMTTRDPLQKEMATQKKDARIHEAEREKHEARAHNATAKQPGGGSYGHDYTTGTGGGTYGHDYTTGTGGPTTGGGYTAEGEGMLHNYPPGTTTTTTGGAGRMGHQDPNVGGGARTGYGSGV
ncbi:hypothetical protein CDL12_30044 [Handroanthus impetiginosus]|uniref:Uncharacterized protein n=1 Tax=Handroanthus impetiginosus TaxID=429701 RepID=A0A2G9FWP9_9LAMI|nr:hypothetical protein CDL12_30044 [Handroanthus impetiginosus]